LSTKVEFSITIENELQGHEITKQFRTVFPIQVSTILIEKIVFKLFLESQNKGQGWGDRKMAIASQITNENGFITSTDSLTIKVKLQQIPPYIYNV
jgi:hypothetical protein